MATVSRAFNDAAVLKPATREKVLRVARELGYDAVSANARKKPVMVVGLLFMEVSAQESDSIYQAAITNSLYCVAASEGVCVMPEPLHLASSGQLEKPKIVSGGCVSGLFVMGHLKESHLEQVLGWGLPVCSLESQMVMSDSHFSVGFDCKAGMREAVQYLAAMGHRRLAFVYGSEEYPANQDKKAGFIETLREFHVEVDLTQMISVADEDQNYCGGLKATQELLSMPNRPTAIIYASDWFAIGGMQAAALAGCRIPQDLSIVGFDDSFMAHQSKPGLTSVNLDIENMVTVGMDSLIRKLTGRTVINPQSMIRPRLAVRGTCGPVDGNCM